MRSRILVLFAHPAFEKSRVHRELVKKVKQLTGITFHDLYEEYPEFEINVAKEQNLLLEHDIIVFQHPFYWYSAPAMIKQWMDLVLEHGWAYGKNGNALQGKQLLSVISAGGPREVYAATGRNRYTIQEFLRPFEQTALLCKMNYLPPFVIHGTHKMELHEMKQAALQYEGLLLAFHHGLLSQEELSRVDYLNDLNPIPEALKD